MSGWGEEEGGGWGGRGRRGPAAPPFRPMEFLRDSANMMLRSLCLQSSLWALCICCRCVGLHVCARSLTRALSVRSLSRALYRARFPAWLLTWLDMRSAGWMPQGRSCAPTT